MVLLTRGALFFRDGLGVALQIFQRADGGLHLTRQWRTAGGELRARRGEEVHRQIQAVNAGTLNST
jgi:hypothetical protein